MVFMDVRPFYNRIGVDHPLQFRTIAGSLAQEHLEASECCLDHQDNPLSLRSGIWLNPSVRVGYNELAYDAVNLAYNHLLFFNYLRGSWKIYFDIGSQQIGSRRPWFACASRNGSTIAPIGRSTASTVDK